MAATNGSARITPENTALSPILFSSIKVGRWVTCRA